MALFQQSGRSQQSGQGWQSEHGRQDGELPLCVFGPGGDYRVAYTGRKRSRVTAGERVAALARLDRLLQELGHVSRLAGRMVAADSWSAGLHVSPQRKGEDVPSGSRSNGRGPRHIRALLYRL